MLSDMEILDILAGCLLLLPILLYSLVLIPLSDEIYLLLGFW